MLKWTLPLGLLLALACSGELPDISGDGAAESEEGEGPAVLPSGAPVSAGVDAPHVDATPAIQRICNHDVAQEMVESWGQRANTPAGIARLCQAHYMDWKSEMDDINPAISDGEFEQLADCIDAAPEQGMRCYGEFYQRLNDNMGHLPSMPGPTPEEISALQGPESLKTLCVTFFGRLAEDGIKHHPERLTECVEDKASEMGMLEMILGKEKVAEITDELTDCLETATFDFSDGSEGSSVLNQCTMDVMSKHLPQ